ncbi:MAG TPA: VOC family protein [Bryobacteraceae bacterium]|nr:VOC family protein [Bryobacteraceae bacterium]
MSSPSPTASPARLASAKIVAFVGTTQPERAKAFYAGTLGLQLVSEDGFALVFDANGTMLRVSTVREIAAAQYTVLGWEVTDIVAKVNEMSQAGVQFERYSFPGQDDMGIWSAPGGARVAWFKDPDGNILSLSQHS